MHAHSSHCCCVPAQSKQALQVNAACYVCVRSQVLAAGVKGNSMHRSHHPEHAPSRPIRMGLTSTRLSDRPGTSSADVLCFVRTSFLLLECCWGGKAIPDRLLALFCCCEQPVVAVTEPHAGAWSFQKSEPATALPCTNDTASLPACSF